MKVKFDATFTDGTSDSIEIEVSPDVSADSIRPFFSAMKEAEKGGKTLSSIQIFKINTIMTRREIIESIKAIYPQTEIPESLDEANHTKALVAAYSLVTADLKQKIQDAEALNKKLKAEQQELREQIRLLKNDGDESQEPSLMDHEEAMESDQRAREIMMDIEAYAASVLAYAEMIKHAQRQQAEFLKTADYQSTQLKAMREAIMEESLSIRKGAAELKKRLQAIQAESETTGQTKPAGEFFRCLNQKGESLKAGWASYADGQENYNTDILTFRSRSFPPVSVAEVLARSESVHNWTARATIYLQNREFLTATFEDATEAAVKQQVERWAQEQFEKIVNALATAFV
jgi:hypothetical protein